MKSLLMLLLAFFVGTTALHANDAKAPAKHAEKKERLSWLDGTVTAVDAATAKISVKNAAGATKDLTVAADARLTKDGKAVTLGQIAVGDRVKAGYSAQGAVLNAKTLKVLSPKK